MIQLLESLVYPEMDETTQLCRQCRDTKRTYELKSGRISGFSAQHCRIILIASGGAAPFDTDGRMSGGGRLIFFIISAVTSDDVTNEIEKQ